jgi:hypothetical protein
METNSINSSEEPIDDDTKFENSDIDPGFLSHQEDSNELKGREDKRENNIDSNLSIKEMREGKKDEDAEEGTDALNYNNDRENGSFNPKNI